MSAQAEQIKGLVGQLMVLVEGHDKGKQLESKVISKQGSSQPNRKAKKLPKASTPPVAQNMDPKGIIPMEADDFEDF